MNRLFDVNHPVTGELFHGREAELEFFWRELFEPAVRGESRYYSVTGMNRIGKTSLFHELCRRFREEGHPGVHVIETTLDNVTGFWRFWVKTVLRPLLAQPFMTQVLEEMDADDAEQLRECRNYFLSKQNWKPLFEGDTVEDMVAKDYLETMFPILYDAGQYIILVIDEFDKAGLVFGQKEENFGWFRSLLQKNQGLSVVTLSRRRIYYIEQNCFGGSTFDSVFSKRGLFGFTNNEIDAYFTRLEEQKVILEQEKKESVWYYCGRSPYYLAIMGEELIRNSVASPDAVSSQFFDSFEAIIHLLKEEKLLTPMLQMFVGPRYNMTESDIQKLVAMGYCMKRSSLCCDPSKANQYTDYYYPENTGEYLTVSKYFIDYLCAVHQADVDNIWPKLTRTERQLRNIIEIEFANMYGATWREDLKTQLSVLFGKPDKDELHANFLREHEKIFRRAGEDKQAIVGNSLLNVVSIRHLRGLIQKQWPVFKKYFSRSKEQFEDDMETLYQARNPISHSNGELLTPTAIAAVESICDQFMTTINHVNRQE